MFWTTFRSQNGQKGCREAFGHILQVHERLVQCLEGQMTAHEAQEGHKGVHAMAESALNGCRKLRRVASREPRAPRAPLRCARSPTGPPSARLRHLWAPRSLAPGRTPAPQAGAAPSHGLACLEPSARTQAHSLSFRHACAGAQPYFCRYLFRIRIRPRKPLETSGNAARRGEIEEKTVHKPPRVDRSLGHLASMTSRSLPSRSNSSKALSAARAFCCFFLTSQQNPERSPGLQMKGN